MIIIDSKFECGDVVRFITDEEEINFVVTGYCIRPTGVLVAVSHNGEETFAYEFELELLKKVSHEQ